MVKKSLLESTNSWKAFLDASKNARQEKDYRKCTLKKIFSIVDPEVSLWPGSIWRALAGFLIGPGFQKGRNLLLYIPCKKFLEKNKKKFINAPLKVIVEFNALISFLFSEAEATSLHLDEKLARRTLSAVEKAFEEAQKGQEALKRIILENKDFLSKTSLSSTTIQAKALETKETPPAPANIQAFSTASPLDDEVQYEILSLLSDATLSYAQENRPSIRDRKIIRMLEQSINEYKNTAQEIRVSLSSPNIVPFKDLLSETPQLGKLPLPKDFLASLFSQKEEDAAASILKAHVQGCLQPLITIKKHAEERAKRLMFIAHEKKRLLHLIEPFIAKKDVKAKAEILISELSRIDIPNSIYQELTSTQVDQVINEKDGELKNVSQKIEKQFKELLYEIRMRTESIDRFIFSLSASLYEIISARTPYPDLMQTTIKVQASLLKEFAEIRHSFVVGNNTLAECKDLMVEASFSPDVRLIRGEITSRSFRLADLKQRILNELSPLDFMICMTGLAQTSNTRILLERQWLHQFLEKLLNPFPLFIDAFNPDSINNIFRYWWEDFERFLKTKPKRRNEYIATMLPTAENIHRPILRTLDIIDKVKGSKIHNAYAAFTEAINGKKGAELLNTCEQFFSNHQKSFVETFVPQLCSIPGREQEPIIEQLVQIGDRIAEITTLARDLQAIKTNESERIDSILSIFSLLSIAPSFEIPAILRLKDTIADATKIISKIEETLLIELGFLNKKARLDQGDSVTSLLPKILLCIPAQIDQKIEILKDLQINQNPYISSLAYYLLNDAYQLQQSLGKVGFNSDKVFEFVQEIALLFVHIKLLIDAKDPENFSSVLLIPTATQYLTASLKKAEKQQTAEFNESISHLESLYFNPLEIANPGNLPTEGISHKLEEYVHTATKLISLLNLTGRRENQLLAGIKNVLHAIAQITVAQKIPVLTYIPGCVTFFTRIRGVYFGP